MMMSIRSALSAAAALLVLAGSAAAQPTTPPPPSEPPYPPLTGADAQAVRDVVRQYQAAVNQRDGAAAARLVTAETRAYYGRLRDLAVSASEAEVRAMPLMERINVLMYRHRIPADELRALPAGEAFAYTIQNGWVDATDGEEVASQGEVYGEGDRAVLRYGEDMPFARESGAWRWDMMTMIRGVGATIGADFDTPEEEEEFLMLVLRMSNGREPSPDLWRPLP